eukprot:CAMPEP_0201867028 /NCGR_PEP_ID=MMETSP0902-20130614/1426_1 /ASSEMBLY_ACC=CAM_ASM_000551 /TAXON_ID=420261 /ORGANISM="Thalassiosira antarctica, Strain CCMP982" /LENGTH=224 /DNA_ID=CAMNT_0048392129 /DNA_START=76 /DNA_END=750 /DNA_ORIENTATION=-
MAWKDTWADILDGGHPRWKVDDLDAKKVALAHIVEHGSPDGPMHILCPLAGDDSFVHYAWSQGHHVTAIDIVPDALKAMRIQFGGMEDWSSESTKGSELVWKHKSGRATLFEGDMLMKRPELMRSFDAIYDKDSFGALQLGMRPKFCERLSEFAKEGGTVYIEVKNKESGNKSGPPFHVEKEDLMEPTAFGAWFEHVSSLGEVYPLKMQGMKQTGHILRRALMR